MDLNITFNDIEVRQTVIKNILKMLVRRSFIKDIDDIYNNLNITDLNTTCYKVPTENNHVEIYFVTQKLTNISHNSPLDIYLSKNPTILKIVIVNDIIKKVAKQLMSDYQNVNFFFEHEMMEDIPEKVFIPTHILLSNEQKKELLSVFAEQELSSILLTDMMSRYYNAKVGDIFKIIRPSYLSGKSIFYRKVISGNIDTLFV